MGIRLEHLLYSIELKFGRKHRLDGGPNHTAPARYLENAIGGMMDGRRLSPWWTVGAGAFANAFPAGHMMVFAYGIMAEAMLAEFGWTRAATASFFSAFLIGSGIGTVVLGWLISRLGVRRPAATFALMFGAAFASVAVLPPNAALFWTIFLIVGITGTACTPMPYAVVISGTFDKHRGLALGIVVAGAGLTAPLFPQLARILTETIGWRAIPVTLGTLAALVSVIALTFFVRTPPGASLDSRGVSGTQRSVRDMYLVNSAFWLISGALLTVSIATIGGITSLIGFYRDRGYDATLIADIMSAAAIAQFISKLLVGYLLDRIHAPLLVAILFAICAAGFILLLTTSGEVSAFVGAACIAVALGPEADILSYLVSRYFPLVEFSRVVGVTWVCFAWGGGLATFIIAAFLARGYGYDPAFALFVLLLAIGALLLSLLGPYRDARQPAADVS